MTTAARNWRVHPACLIHAATIARGRVFVAETDPAQPPLILRDHRVAWALAALPPRFTKDAALALWADVLGDEARRAFDALASEQVLVPDDGRHAAYDEWTADGWWEAALFHVATRDYPFLAMDAPGAGAADAARMERYLADGPPPPAASEAGDASLLPLPRLPDDGWERHVEELPDELARGAHGAALALDACCGIRRKLDFGAQGVFHGKAPPSGGARHPTDAFLASFALDGIAPGVYRYLPPDHALAEIGRGDTSERFREATFDLFDRSTRPPRALVVFASTWQRAMWRYRDDRSARAPLIDVGHVVQVFRVIADRLGFEVRSYQKVRDRVIAELCQIEPRRVTPLFVATLA